MKKTSIVLLGLACFFIVFKANASHQNGGNITWTCIGQDSFLISVIQYGDCNGIVITPIPLLLSNQLTGSTITTLNITFSNPVDITPVCNSFCTRCQSASCSFPYGILQYTGQGIVNLNSAGSACKILISWNGGSRNYASTSTAYNPYFESIMDRCQNPCDNSPVFKDVSYPLICYGQDYTLDFGVTDADTNSNGILLDSFTYELTPPLENYNTPIQYNSSYSYDKPIYFLGFPNDALVLPSGFHLNSQTGILQFRPQKIETTFLAVKVSEFRNGIKIAEITQDIFVIVISCASNNKPSVSTPNNIISRRVCPDDTVSFNFTTNDLNANDTVTISWNNAIPGAVWTDNNGQSKHPSANLSWVPGITQFGHTYNFIVSVKDNSCPIPAEVIQSYQIIVDSPVIKLNPIDKLCDNGSSINLNNYVRVDGTFKTGGTWSSPVSGLVTANKFDPVAAGESIAPGWKVRYDYTDALSGCSAKDSAYVTVFHSAKPYAGNDDSICSGRKISLMGTPFSATGIWLGTAVGGYPLNWWFNPDTTGISNGGSYLAIYRYTDTNNCKNEDTLSFTVFQTAVVNAGSDTDFCTDANSINLTGTPSGGIWRGKGIAGNRFFPSNAGTGAHLLTYTYTNVICTVPDTAIYSVWPLPMVTAATQSGDAIFCRNEGLIQLNGQPSGTGGVWTGPGITGTIFNTRIGADQETDYSLLYEYTDIHNCTNKAGLTIRVRPEPAAIIDAPSGWFCFNNPFSINASYKNAAGIFWWKGLQSDGTITGNPTSQTIGYNPGFNDLKSLHFWLHIKTTHSDSVCAPAVDSIKINMSAMPVCNFFGSPTSGNAPFTVQFYDSSTVNPGTISTWHWDFGDGNFSILKNPVHTYLQKGNYSVKLIVSTTAGCDDSLVKTNYISIATGIAPFNIADKIKYYPNPANGSLNVESSLNETAKLIMTDVLGNSILEYKIINGNNQLNIQNFKSGIYFIFLEGMIAGKVLIE